MKDKIKVVKERPEHLRQGGQTTINREGVSHPIGTNINSDGEDEFNDAEEITDETMNADEEINSVVEPEIQIEATEKRKQPSPRDRRRTRSMAAAAKKTPRKERWILL